jgi:NTP pyrophosphatase (non-canonical NTP hydrolase)
MEISKIQNIIKFRYYNIDKKRGIPKTFLWFMEEVGELSSALASEDINNVKEELGDVLMWLFSIANICEIDIENCINIFLNNQKKINGYK